MPALAVTIGAAVAVPLLSFAPPAQAAGGNVGGGWPVSARTSASSVINSPGFAGYQAPVTPGSATSSAARFKVPKLSCTSAYRGIAPGAGVVVNAFRSVSTAYLFAVCHQGRVLYFLALVVNGNQVNYATPVHAGNVIKVSAKVTTTRTTVQVTDVTTGVTKKRTGRGARSSAAYVGDDGVIANGILRGVPSFGTLTFTNCLIDGKALAHSHPHRFQRVNSRKIVQIATGALSSGGTAFPTYYKHF
jgi:hypothetical protein